MDFGFSAFGYLVTSCKNLIVIVARGPTLLQQRGTRVAAANLTIYDSAQGEKRSSAHVTFAAIYRMIEL